MDPATVIRRLLARSLGAFAVVAVLAAGCGDDSGASGDTPPEGSDPVDSTSSTTTVPGTTVPIPEEGLALVELQLSIVEFGADGFVEIVNLGETDADVNGIFIGQDPTYADLGTIIDGATIAAGATAQVPADDWGGLDAASGEAALSNGDDFDSPEAILSYVQWGEAGHALAGVAAEAGLWPSADDTVTPDPEFNSIESGGFPADPENWS